MALCIVMPTVAAVLYYSLFASDRYVSDTQMVMSDQTGTTSPLSSLAGAAGAAGGKSSLLSLVGMEAGSSGGGSDSAIVTNYLQSTQAMEALDKTIGLRKMWSAASIDYLSRLSAKASSEDFKKYYDKHITVIADPLNPVIELRVQAFRPQDARLIAQTLVKLAQQTLNAAFEGMREDALRFARSEVTNAQQQLASIDEKVRKFRNVHAEVDPAAGAQGVGAVALGLYGQLATAEAQLRMTLSYAREESPAVKTIEAQIAALRTQIGETRTLLAGDEKGKPYADLLGAYEDLLLNQTFAQSTFTSAMGFLESSRAALAHQQKYLIDFLAPTLPEDAVEPTSIRNVVVVFLASVLLWLIGSLVAAALSEHAHR
jgi:capsular polysaccharide transport system permease protein